MKRCVISLFAACAAFLSAYAAEPVDGIYWTSVIHSGCSTVEPVSNTGYESAIPKNTTGRVDVPGVLGGRPVTCIGSNAFVNCEWLISANIPDGVERIETGAFLGCTNLYQVSIAPSVTHIARDAFEGTYILVSSPESVIADGWLLAYNAVTQECVVVSNGVTGIAGGVFENRTAMKSVMIPESVKYIGEYAFANCTGLTNLVIPAGVEVIEKCAFAGCSNLESVTIPSTVRDIGDSAFAGCMKLGPQLVVKDGWALTYNGGGSWPESVYIPDGVKGIAGGVFSGGSHIYERQLEHVRFPAGLLYICDYAFANCWILTPITIPDGVKRIGEGAFMNCWSEGAVTIPSSVESIGDRAFYDFNLMTALTIEDGVRNIGEYAFAKCRRLRDVEIPGSVTVVGDYAFSECGSLTNAVMNNGIQIVGHGVFRKCWVLESVAIPGAPYIGDNMYEECNQIYSAVAPGRPCGINLATIVSLVIADGTTRIEDRAFEDCQGLKSLTIPSSVTEIGAYAFSGCSGLKTLTIPSSVTSVGSGAFSGCVLLESVTVPGWKCEIPFLPEQTPPSETQSAITELSISKGTVRIKDGAFDGCSAVKRVTIPLGVTSIGSYAFRGCDGLTVVELPAGVEEIGSYAFCGCGGLTAIEIPSTVTKIGAHAFDGCSGLTEFEIPSNVTSIAEEAFAQCTGLISLEIPSSVTQIGKNAFSGCSGLSSLIIPESVEEVDESAFTGCSNLKTVYATPEKMDLVKESLIGSGCAIEDVDCVVYNPQNEDPGDISGGFTGDSAKTFNGLLYASDGGMCGIIQVVAGKKNASGVVRVSGFVMLDDGKKLALKAAYAPIEDGKLSVETMVAGTRTLTLVIRRDGFSGLLDDMTAVSKTLFGDTGVVKGVLTLYTFDSQTGKLKTKKVNLGGVTATKEVMGTLKVKGEEDRLFSGTIE